MESDTSWYITVISWSYLYHMVIKVTGFPHIYKGLAVFSVSQDLVPWKISRHQRVLVYNPCAAKMTFNYPSQGDSVNFL